MMTLNPFGRWLPVLGVLLGMGGADEAHAGAEYQVAAADCYSIGLEVAAEKGGTLARASQLTRGDQTVCLIVVLVPGRDGERPRRAEFEVPAN